MCHTFMISNIGRTFLLMIIISLIPLSSVCQSWSQPVTIYQGSSVNYPDITTDQNGVIHCVWNRKLGENYWKIFYSKSNDGGVTWSPEEDISLNTYLWMSQPHIVADSENNLYVSYDYNAGSPSNILVLLRKFNGTNWSIPDTISTGLPGSMFNRLVIDNNNKLYCFWYRSVGNGKIFYRTFENGEWGNIQQPFEGNDYALLGGVVCDKNNRIHCCAQHRFLSYPPNHIIYFYYDNGIWSDYTILNWGDAWAHYDIALESDSIPHITWRQATSNTAPPNDGTFYAYLSDTGWTAPELIVEDPSHQAIIVDKYGITHIIDNEKTENGYQQVHYQKIAGNWIGEIIDENPYGFAVHKLVAVDSTLFLLYITRLPNSNPALQVKRYNAVPVGVYSKFVLPLKIYPNPTKDITFIDFESFKSDFVQVKILDLHGHLVNTLMNTYAIAGQYSLLWNGNDLNGNMVSSGIYLVRVRVGQSVVTRSVVINK